MTPLLILLAVTGDLAPTEWVAPTAPPLGVVAGAAPSRYDTEASTPANPPAAKPVATPAETPAATPLGSAPFEQRMIAAELALSSIVVERPDRWRFERLESEAAELLSVASSEADRAAVRSLSDRVDRFRRLGVRLRNNHGGADSVAGWQAPRAPLGPGTARIAPPVRLTKTAPVGAQHDAQGVLRTVVSQRADAPKYAVIDDEGQIAALVTPDPTIDAQLKTLVGKRVGLDGKRGYLTDLRREHVVAERVTPLDTRLR